MNLHIIKLNLNSIPPTHSLFETLSEAHNDKFILIEDATYSCHHAALNELTHEQLFVLESDYLARGIILPSPNGQFVDYLGFVELVAACQRSITWQ